MSISTRFVLGPWDVDMATARVAGKQNTSIAPASIDDSDTRSWQGQNLKVNCEHEQAKQLARFVIPSGTLLLLLSGSGTAVADANAILNSRAVFRSRAAPCSQPSRDQVAETDRRLGSCCQGQTQSRKIAEFSVRVESWVGRGR